MQLAAINGDCHGGGEERLGSGTDLEDRLRVNWWAVFTTHAISLAADRFVAYNNSDRHAGDLERFHAAGHILVEFRNEFLNALLDTGIRRARLSRAERLSIH